MYEYRIIFELREDAMREKLNIRGKDGWRLHTFTKEKEGFRAVMERPIPQEAQNETQPMGMK